MSALKADPSGSADTIILKPQCLYGYSGYCYSKVAMLNWSNRHTWLAASMLDTTDLKGHCQDR